MPGLLEKLEQMGPKGHKAYKERQAHKDLQVLLDLRDLKAQ